MEINSILDLIGNTPMVKLERVNQGIEANIFVKLEHLNPSGSIKDRIALHMIDKAEEEEIIKPGYNIIEASTGNTAIAFSFVGAVKGYKVTIFMPKIMQEEKVKIMQRYGSEIELVDVEEELKDRGIHGAYVEVPGRIICKEKEERNPRVWWARQFSNPANVEAHHETGREILRQMDGKIDVFLASVGTGGTLLGIAEALKAELPDLKIYAVEPAEATYMTLSDFDVIPGVTGGILSDIREKGIVDEILKISDGDAVDMAHRLSKEEGLFVGMSSGANVFAAINVAKKLRNEKNIVTVLPDSGDRYFSAEHYTT